MRCCPFHCFPAVTYPLCAYIIPAFFTVKLLGPRLHWSERALYWVLVPSAVLLSVAGLAASVTAMIGDILSGSGGDTPALARMFASLVGAS